MGRLELMAGRGTRGGGGRGLRASIRRVGGVGAGLWVEVCGGGGVVRGSCGSGRYTDG